MNSASKEEKLIEIVNCKKYFYSGGSFLGNKQKITKAVDDVSFHIIKGETFGLVGESGCGKSTLGRTITRIYDVTSGNINYQGTDISQLKKTALKPYRKKMQVIFQDPYSALNPYYTIGDIIDEPMEIHLKLPKVERVERAVELLEKVGLRREDLSKFPHQFSGGQRQRIGVARALSVSPEFMLCDEPISALDVSIQAQVVNMLQSLQEQLGLTYLFVAHDLSMVKHISNRIGVMYLGKIMEISDSNELYKNPLHPYTQALLSAIPIPDPKKARASQIVQLKGEIPSPLNVPSGCRFRTRCPQAQAVCTECEPELVNVSGNHMVACHLLSAPQ